jgi:hypothetical protein
MSDARRPIAWQQLAVILAVWSLAYDSYRAYYAAGGNLGMIGQPSRRRAWITAAAAACILLTVAGVMSGLGIIRAFYIG